ncbi:MAG: hypothetical protein AB1847_10755 [bacterium]
MEVYSDEPRFYAYSGLVRNFLKIADCEKYLAGCEKYLIVGSAQVTVNIRTVAGRVCQKGLPAMAAIYPAFLTSGSSRLNL